MKATCVPNVVKAGSVSIEASAADVSKTKAVNVESVNSAQQMFDGSSMQKELRLRGYSVKTIKAYIGHIERLAAYYNRVSCNLEEKDIKNYLLVLIEKKGCKYSYVQQALSAIKFYYVNIVRKSYITSAVPFPRKEHQLPDVLSQNEVAAILNHTENLKHKAILFLIYAAGLRVGEVVRMKAASFVPS